MVRYIGPHSRVAYIPHVDGELDNANSRTATVFASDTGSTLADILTYDGTPTPGAAIAGSQITVDDNSLIPQFWFPDGVTRVYIQFPGGVRTEAYVSIAEPSTYIPPDHGMFAWSFDPSMASTGQLLTNGTVYLIGVQIRRQALVSRIHWMNSTAGVGPVAGQNFAGIYNSSGTLLGSVNIDASITGLNSPQSATLATPLPLTPGLYWVAFVTNAATPPTFIRSNGAFAGTNNVNLAAAVRRYAINGLLQTSLPASITPASNAVGIAAWVGVS